MAAQMDNVQDRVFIPDARYILPVDSEEARRHGYRISGDPYLTAFPGLSSSMSVSRMHSEVGSSSSLTIKILVT